MPFTLDPEVAEALAFTPPPGSTLPPTGGRRPRIAMPECTFRYADTARELATADGATIRALVRPQGRPRASPAPPRSTCTAAA